MYPNHSRAGGQVASGIRPGDTYPKVELETRLGKRDRGVEVGTAKRHSKRPQLAGAITP